MGKHATIELQDPQGVNMIRTQKDRPENNPITSFQLPPSYWGCDWNSHSISLSTVGMLDKNHQLF